MTDEVVTYTRRIIPETASSFVVPATGGNVIAQGVHFDGSTYFTKASAMTGAVGSGVGTLNMWFKMGGTDGTTVVFYDIRQAGPSASFFVVRNSDNTIRVLGRNTSAVTVLDLKSTTTTYTTSMSSYSNVIASWDLSIPRAQMWIDNADVSNVVTATAGEVIDMAAAGSGGFFDLGVGAVGDGTLPVTADTAAFWMDFTTSFDLNVAGNRQLFRSAGGNAVDLGSDGSTPLGGTPPIFYLNAINPSGVATWNTNKGSGAGFTVTAGALTAAATNPP